MGRIIIVVALALAGCGLQPTPAEQASIDIVGAQQNLNRLVPACRDGIQYLVSPWRPAHTFVVVPRLKPDGKPFTCEVK